MMAAKSKVACPAAMHCQLLAFSHDLAETSVTIVNWSNLLMLRFIRFELVDPETRAETKSTPPFAECPY